MSAHSGTGRDAGLSLVELIVVVMVSALFLGVLATVFGTSLASQQQSADRDAATGRLNAVRASVTSSVRHSDALLVRSSGTRLDARVLGEDGSAWECRAWQLQGGELRYSAGGAARGALDASWAVLSERVSGTLDGGGIFAGEPSGRQITLGIRVVQGDTAVTAEDRANAQVVQSGGPACW